MKTRTYGRREPQDDFMEGIGENAYRIMENREREEAELVKRRNQGEKPDQTEVESPRGSIEKG